MRFRLFCLFLWKWFLIDFAALRHDLLPKLLFAVCVRDLMRGHAFLCFSGIPSLLPRPQHRDHRAPCPVAFDEFS